MCCPKSETNIPMLNCNFSLNNKKQKQYIMDLIDNINYNKPLKVTLQTNTKKFSVILDYNNKKNNITAKTYQESLEKLNNIIEII